MKFPILAGMLLLLIATSAALPRGDSDDAEILAPIPRDLPGLSQVLSTTVKLTARSFKHGMGSGHQSIKPFLVTEDRQVIRHFIARLVETIGPIGNAYIGSSTPPYFPCNGTHVELDLADGRQITLEGEHWSGSHCGRVTATGWDDALWVGWGYGRVLGGLPRVSSTPR